MRQDKRIIFSIIWIIAGSVLIGLAFAGIVDAFWNGMGSGLLVVGILQLLRFYRFNKNEEYRVKIKTEEQDERNQFIRNKAWAWTGYWFLMLAAVLSIVFRIIGQVELSLAASYSVCIMLVLYWISYAILKRKY